MNIVNKNVDKKIKILAFSDSPTCATGFGTVARNIYEGLYKTGRYDIDILGINYWGDPHNFPYRIWPTGTNQDKDPYGRKKVCSMMPKMEYDVLFFLQDTFILNFLPELMNYLSTNNLNTKSICYFPIDGTPKEQWIKNISVVDQPIAYSKFGMEQAFKVYSETPTHMTAIPHGVNVSDFFVQDVETVKKFRKQYFGEFSDHYIIMNINRNQQRKDIPRTIQAFVEFRKQVPKSILYLHMAKIDQGWNLSEVIKSFGLNEKTDVIFPNNFGPNQGFPLPVVNMLYNISDCVVSTTTGEGHGLGWGESMATKTPVIMPANTILPEFITEDRGYLVKSGGDPSLYTVLPNDNEVIRPLVDVNDLVEKMVHVYNNPEEAKEKAETAYKWITTDFDWQGPIAKQWVKVFDNVYNSKNKKDEMGLEKTIEAEEF